MQQKKVLYNIILSNLLLKKSCYVWAFSLHDGLGWLEREVIVTSRFTQNFSYKIISDDIHTYAHPHIITVLNMTSFLPT